MSLVEKIDQEVHAVEADAKAEAVTLFDKARVDLRTEMPALMSKLGINTNDEHGVLHAAVILVIQLLAEFGPAEIRTVLAGL